MAPPGSPDEHAEAEERNRELVERVREGDPRAYDAFIREHWKPLVHFIAQSVRSVEDAKDLAQEAFFRVWDKRRSLRPNASLRAYLFHIARNLGLDENRRRRVRERWSVEAERLNAEPGYAAEALDALQHAELMHLVRRAVDSLPPRRRQALTLVHVHGFSYKEAAGIMAIAPQTLADQVAAAIAQLRRMLVRSS